MTVDPIVEQIIALPPADAKKIGEYLSGEEFMEAVEEKSQKRVFE